jgi:putative transcriptional regulator
MIVNRLPQILAERGLSIRELARRSSVTYSTIWAVVHGERRSVQLEVLDAICLVLNAQPGDIYTVVSGDGTLAAGPSTATSLEDKKEELGRQDLKERGGPIQANQNRRPVRPDKEWRSW